MRLFLVIRVNLSDVMRFFVGTTRLYEASFAWG